MAVMTGFWAILLEWVETIETKVLYSLESLINEDTNDVFYFTSM